MAKLNSSSVPLFFELAVCTELAPSEQSALLFVTLSSISIKLTLVLVWLGIQKPYTNVGYTLYLAVALKIPLVLL